MSERKPESTCRVCGGDVYRSASGNLGSLCGAPECAKESHRLRGLTQRDPHSDDVRMSEEALDAFFEKKDREFFGFNTEHSRDRMIGASDLPVPEINHALVGHQD